MLAEFQDMPEEVVHKHASFFAANKKHWKTEAAFLSYVRGGLRRGLWMNSPVKREFETSHS